MLSGVRVKTRLYKIMKRGPRRNGIRNGMKSCGCFKTIKIKRIIPKPWLSILKLTNCTFLHVATSPATNHFPCSFKARFKSLIDQYELRELHFHSLLRTKELEVQYNIARFDRERRAAEQEVNRAKQLNQQVLTFSKTETELRNQLNIYVEKFKQVWPTFHT